MFPLEITLVIPVICFNELSYLYDEWQALFHGEKGGADGGCELGEFREEDVSVDEVFYHTYEVGVVSDYASGHDDFFGEGI